MKQSLSPENGPQDNLSTCFGVRILRGGSCILAPPRKAPQNCQCNPQVAVLRGVMTRAINRALLNPGLSPGREAPGKRGSLLANERLIRPR